MLEQERQRIEQLTAGWDDPTAVDWGNEEPDHDQSAHRHSESSGPALKCTALYSYTVRLDTRYMCLTVAGIHGYKIIGFSV